MLAEASHEDYRVTRHQPPAPMALSHIFRNLNLELNLVITSEHRNHRGVFHVNHTIPDPRVPFSFGEDTFYSIDQQNYSVLS
jgi:hypothetical protein